MSSTVSLGVGDTMGGSGMAATGDPLEVGGVCCVVDEGTAAGAAVSAASSSGSGFTCTSTFCNGTSQVTHFFCEERISQQDNFSFHQDTIMV